jgi:hypothetical protein
VATIFYQELVTKCGLSKGKNGMLFKCEPQCVFSQTHINYTSISQTFFKWGPLLLATMFYGPPYSCPLWKQIYHFLKWWICLKWKPLVVCNFQTLFEILNYSVWYAIHVNFIFLSFFFWVMFNLRGPQGQNPRTTCGPRTTVW